MSFYYFLFIFPLSPLPDASCGLLFGRTADGEDHAHVDAVDDR